MINWLWAIPWIVVIIFYAGWHFGGKVTVRKEIQEQDHRDSISDIYKYLAELENKIERLYATKEEKVNG